MKEILYLILLNIFLFNNQNKENFIILNNLKNINKTIYNDFNNSLTTDFIKNEINIFSNISNKINNYLNLLNNNLEFESFNHKFSHSFNLNKDFSKEFIFQSQNFIENENCFFYHIFIMKNLNNKNFFLFCINKKAKNISLFNITNSNSLIFHSKINLNLNLKNENDIKISFTFFNEENIILLYSDSNIYIINININVVGKDIYIPMTKNFYLNKNVSNSEIIIFDSVIYHMNKYIIIAFKNEINVYLLKKDKIQIKANFILENNVDNIIIKEGFILLLTNNHKKMTFLSLLGGNNILLTCEFYYKIISYYYDYNNEFLYTIDEKGRLLINYIKINLNKIFNNECSIIYKYDLPKFILKNNEFNFIFVKRELYFWTKNYIVFINKNYMLEEYFINLEKNFNIYNNENKYILIGQNSDYVNVYKINNFIEKKIKKQKKNKSKNINQNVECNGNLICNILFNTYTNNKYITTFLYIICILLIAGTVIYLNKKRKEDNLKFKEIEEKNEKQNKENTEKVNKLIEQIKNLEKFQPYKNYKKTKEENEKNQKNYNENNENEEEDFEEIEDFEDDEEDELKEYHRYMKDIIKNKKNLDKNNENYDEENSNEEENEN